MIHSIYRRITAAVMALMLCFAVTPLSFAEDGDGAALPEAAVDTALALAATDGAAAAEYVNSFGAGAGFDELVRQVLDSYYGASGAAALSAADTGSTASRLADFAAGIDGRASDALANYAEAAAERGADPAELGYAPGRVIAVFDAAVYNAAGFDGVSAVRGTVTGEIDMGDRVTVFVEPSLEDTVARAAARLSAVPGVVTASADSLYILPDEASSAAATGSEIYYYQNMVEAVAAWDILAKLPTARVRVVVADTGCDINHPDLQKNLNKRLSVDIIDARVDGSYGALVRDEGRHGTHVSGIVAATNGNGAGTAGIATGNDNSLVELVVCNVFQAVVTSEGTGLGAYTSDCVLAIDYAVSIGAKVLNFSLGGYSYDSAWGTAISYAYNNGCLVVCAAGNDNYSDSYLTNYPSDVEPAISVISLDSDSTRSYYSNYGAKKDVSAPGSYILSTLPTASSSTGYAYLSGTSMASPVATGVTSLIWAILSDAEPAAVRALLLATCDDLGASGFDTDTAWGCVNAMSAVREAVCDEAGTPTLTAERTASGVILTPGGTDSEYTDYFTLDIYRAADEGVYTLLASVAGAATPYTDTTVRNGHTYSYYVVQTVTGDSGDKYGFNSSLTADADLLGAPVTPAAVGVSGGITVSGYAVGGANSYAIYRSAVAAGGNDVYSLVKTTSAASWTDTGVTSGVVYRYRVVASYETTAGDSSAAVMCLCAVPPAAFAAADGEGISVSWSAVAGVDGYEVYRAASGGEYARLAAVDTFMYSDGVAAADTEYSYRVALAYTAPDGTEGVTPAGAASESALLPSGPAVTVAVALDGLKLSFTSVSAVTGYDIYRAASKNGEYTLLAESASAAYTDDTVENGTAYWYKVCAYRTRAGGTDVGAMSAAVSGVRPDILLELTSDVYTLDRDGALVTGAARLTTVTEFIAGFENPAEYMRVVTAKGAVVSSGAYVGTGMIVQTVVGGEVADSMTVAVRGDVNGDGYIDIADVLSIQSHILETKPITSPLVFGVADLNSDAYADVADILIIIDDILGKALITP